MEEDNMQKNKKILLISVLVLLACTGFACAGTPMVGKTSDDGVVPTLIAGEAPQDQWCSVAECEGSQFKIAGGLASGTHYVDGTHFIKITAYTVDSQTSNNAITWESNFPVNCIIVKGANGADSYSYCYDPSNNDDSGLTPPVAGSSGKPAAISDIYLCYSPPSTDVPEFPAWFITLTGIAGLVGMLVACLRK
jgi:hypothetical protein